MKVSFVLSCLLGTIVLVESSRILFLSTVPAVSHFRLSFHLAKELADRGHEVTVVNPFPRKEPIRNYRDISIAETVPWLEKAIGNLFDFDKKGAIWNLKLIYDTGLSLTKMIYINKDVQELLHSNETFDVLVMEQFATEGLLGIAHHFNIPSVIISGFGMSSINNHFYANPAPSSYIPNIMMGAYKRRMNFWQRLENFFANIVFELIRECYFLPQHRKLLKKHINAEVELDDLVHNVSIILSNSHPSIHDAAPLTPNMIHVAGYHMFPPEKLPQDLQNYLDSSKEGVVLFSMGSILRSKDLKPEVRDYILRAFSRIKQNVLWKFETQIENLPKNVKIVKWLPQQDVLAHPNIRAFITHGGMLSTVEAVTFGVPMIGIPVFGDQMTNIDTLDAKDVAIGIPLSQLSEEKLTWALDEILNNPKYRVNMKRMSSLMNDRPLKPIDEAVYWVEYVIRHKGAAHLRTAAVDLPWYQREMVDIISFFVVVSIGVSLIVLFALRRLFKLIVHRKAGVEESKKKN